MINNQKTTDSVAVHVKERIMIRYKDTKEILLDKVEDDKKGIPDENHK
jgi:hypothetical protein